MIPNDTGRGATDPNIEQRLNELETALAKAATVHQQLEKALADERTLLRTVIDNLPDAIYFKDTASRILLDNVAHARTANLTPPEMVGHTDLDLYPAPQARAFYADEQAILRSGRPLIAREEQTFGPDRAPIWALTTKVPVRDQDGQIIGIVGITRDITPWKQAEAALQSARNDLERQVEARTADLEKTNADLLEQIARRQAAERALADERNLLRTLIDNLPDLIYIKDTMSRFLLCNQAQLHYLGVTTFDAAAGKTDADFFPVEHAAQYYADEQPVLRQGQPLIGRNEPVICQTTGQPTWIQTTKIPLRNEAGQVIGLVGIGHDISGRRRMEEVLEHERNLLRTLIDNLPDAIYVKDAQSRLVINNVAHARMIGVALPEQCTGKSDFDLFPPAMAERFFQDDQRILTTGIANVEYEEQILDHATNTLIWAVTTKAPLRDKTGQITGLVGISRNVTERRHAAALLEQERRLLRTLIDNIPDYIYVKDDRGRFLLSNLAHSQAAGQLTADALIGKTAFDFFPPALAPQFHADDMAVIQSGQPLLNAERVTIDQNGRTRHVLTTKVPLMNPEQQIIGLVGISRDITKRKLAEDALERERNWLHTLLDNLPDHIYIKDTEGRFVLANDAVVQGMQTPLTLDDLIGKTDLDMDPSEQGARYFADEQALLRSGQPLINKEQPTIDRAGRPHWLLITKVPLRDSHGKIIGLVGINRDFTQLKQAEEALAQTARELKRSNEELQQFAYVASHDLQEPLRMITSYLQLLEKRYTDKLDTDAHEFIGYAIDGAARMKRLISDLLAYSRVTTQGKSFEPVNCEMMLLQSLLNLQVAIEDHHAQVTYDPLPTVMGDSIQLAAVFQNLIGNAIKFHGDRPPQVHITAQRQEHVWCFSVQDNGIGIAPEYAERIFVIFGRLHPQAKYPGTGIGLAICKRVVERHGGRIWVESQPDQGATFFFTIPA